MTNTQADGTNLVVVDGSNIATEGRSVPSLAQLNEAVISLTQEFPDITVTVVVDATFGHRIDKSEVHAFDEAVAHNELVTPPAGAIGRGDAFVLSIANKVGARIFSNDSFQEFHGVYPWLFDEGRLIGGKPVPYVGWVFVNRVPVKGPVSRKARGAGRDGGSGRRPVSPMASLPMPIPTSPPPRAAAKAKAKSTATPDGDVPPGPAPAAPARAKGRRRTSDAMPVAETVPATGRDATKPPSTSTAAPSGAPVNDLLPFLEFIQNHPVGSSVTGTVESYSSHGAYVTIGDLRGYVPLRLMGNPPPRSAREVMRSGEEVTLVVANVAPARRSVDLAVAGVVDAAPLEPAPPAPVSGRRRAKPVPAKPTAADGVDGTAEPRGRRRKAAATAPEPAPTIDVAPRRGRKAAAAAPVEMTSVAPGSVEGATDDKAPVGKSAASPKTTPRSTGGRKPSPAKSAAKKPARAVTPTDASSPAATPAAEPQPATRTRSKRSADAAPSASESSVTGAGTTKPAKQRAAGTTDATKAPRKRAAKGTDAAPAATKSTTTSKSTTTKKAATQRRRAQPSAGE